MQPCFVILLTCAIAGCDFLGYPRPIRTTTPSPEQVQYCRNVMYIDPGIEIEPVGFFLQSGMDDVIRFKFIAKTDDPARVFDGDRVDAARLAAECDAAALDPDAGDAWWDVGARPLRGASFTVPPPDSPGMRGLRIGYRDNQDGTLTCYVLWHET